MNSNYMFDFNRNSVAAPRVAPVAMRVAPKAVAPKAAAPKAAAPKAAPAAVANPSDRFSMNRLISLKSTGGCRSCN
jgi:hypothetical protein